MRVKGYVGFFSEGVKWGMGWVGVGTAVFGAPRFLPKPWKIQHFPQKDAKSGRPKNSRSYPHPSHPPLDALLVLGGGFCCSTPQYRRGQGERRDKHTGTHTHTHTGTYTRMMHLLFCDLPFKRALFDTGADAQVCAYACMCVRVYCAVSVSVCGPFEWPSKTPYKKKACN